MIEVGVLARSMPGVVEVDLFEWSSPGVVGMGEGKPSRGVLFKVHGAFLSNRGADLLGI